MRRALELAENGRGSVSPNPLVGCVVTYKGRILGEGWHQQFGGPHAEVNAIGAVQATELLPDATVYVTLEPCAHHGKTPPCADLLVESGVKRVVVALNDPNPKVNGGGLAKLQAAGIETTVGVLEDEARAQNRRFLTAMQGQRPYVVLKWAQTADGFVARANYDSKWISNAQSRQWVHRWRAEEDAIMVGPNTVRQDNPSLTVRDWSGSHPTRIILDRQAGLEGDFTVFDGQVPTHWYTQQPAEARPGVETIALPGNDFLPQVLHHMHGAGLHSVLVEGGGAILRAFMEANLWDEARVFVAPNAFMEGVAAPVVTGRWRETIAVGNNELRIFENTNTLWPKR